MTTPHDYYLQAVEKQAEAAALFRRATWSPLVPMIDYDDIDTALESERLMILSLGARWCEKCAIMLRELERVAVEPRFQGVAVFRHDLDTSNPPGLALSRFPDPDGATPPLSETGVYEHQIPLTIYFEQGEEIRRGYGVIDFKELLFDWANRSYNDLSEAKADTPPGLEPAPSPWGPAGQ